MPSSHAPLVSNDQHLRRWRVGIASLVLAGASVLTAGIVAPARAQAAVTAACVRFGSERWTVKTLPDRGVHRGRLPHHVILRPARDDDGPRQASVA